MCSECNVLAYQLDHASDGLAAAQEYARSLEAERDALLLQVAYLTKDRDQKRAERDALRDELAAVKRRVLAWQTGVKIMKGNV